MNDGSRDILLFKGDIEVIYAVRYIKTKVFYCLQYFNW